MNLIDGVSAEEYLDWCKNSDCTNDDLLCSACKYAPICDTCWFITGFFDDLKNLIIKSRKEGK